MMFGLVVHFLADAVGGLIDLEQRHVVAAGDVDQQAARAGHRGVFQQRVVDRRLGGADRAVLAVGFAGAHHRLAHLRHHRADIGEVEIDQARRHHQVGDAAHAHVQHLVGHLEGLAPGGALVRHPEQVLVRDDDQRVDVLLQFVDARPRRRAARRLPSKSNGLVTTPTVRMLRSARHARDHRRRAGAGAAAHAGGDEHHVRAIQVAIQLVRRLFGRGAPDLRLGAGAEALRDVRPELDAPVRPAVHQLLRVGVGDDELHALQVRRDHVVDGVGAAAADADDGDARREVGVQVDCGNRQVQGHWRLSPPDLRVRLLGCVLRRQVCRFACCISTRSCEKIDERGGTGRPAAARRLQVDVLQRAALAGRPGQQARRRWRRPGPEAQSGRPRSADRPARAAPAGRACARPSRARRRAGRRRRSAPRGCRPHASSPDAFQPVVHQFEGLLERAGG